MAGTRAGLGWIGKSDLFISYKFGPRLRLATVLIISTAEYCDPVTESECGSCTICVDSCPAGAMNGKLWKVGVDRTDFYDADKCFKMCRRLSLVKMNRKVSICGICVAVCPHGS